MKISDIKIGTIIRSKHPSMTEYYIEKIIEVDDDEFKCRMVYSTDTTMINTDATYYGIDDFKECSTDIKVLPKTCKALWE